MRFPEDVPILTDGEDLRLRAHRPDDIDDFLAMCSDPGYQAWTDKRVPYSRSDAEHFLTELVPSGWREGRVWGWALEHHGRFAGNIDLGSTADGGGDVGFGLAPWARGIGLTQRAVKLVLRFAFDQLKWDVVLWRAIAGNWASRRVAWRTGFRGFTTVRGAGTLHGQRRDEWAASIKRDEEQEPQSHWWSVPVLEDGKVRLRPHRASDVQRIVEACRDPRTQHWLPSLPSPYTLEDAEAFIASKQEGLASGDRVTWVVADPDTDELLANVGVVKLTGTFGEIGYWAHPEARGRGVVTTAVGLVVRHALTPIEYGGLGRHRLELTAAKGNKASQHVALANGFTRSGIRRQASLRRDGTREDLLVFDLLESDDDRQLPFPSPSCAPTGSIVG
jgi:RimJ/RimL family protein N-acetyltransferase